VRMRVEYTVMAYVGEVHHDRVWRGESMEEAARQRKRMRLKWPDAAIRVSKDIYFYRSDDPVVEVASPDDEKVGEL